jgi:hypothetical protein
MLVDAAEKKPQVANHFRSCHAAGRPAIVLIAEGKA